MRGSVGLIGYGRFGRLAARYCAPEADVLVYDPAVRVPSSRGIRRASLSAAAAQPVVVLAVPISELKGVLRSIRSLVRPGALVVDVCSVKVLPLRWMKAILPPSVSIVGTHPLFGPDSDTGTLAGQKVVVVPSRGGKRWMGKMQRLAASHRIRLAPMTPRAHDRFMAETLLLTQYVGRLIHGMRLPVRASSTLSHAHLSLVVRTALRDSEQLFVDMWRFNPYAADIARLLARSHRALLRRAGAHVDI